MNTASIILTTTTTAAANIVSIAAVIVNYSEKTNHGDNFDSKNSHDN